MKKGIIKEVEKETNADVVKSIRESMDKIERARQKAYVLQELFAGKIACDDQTGTDLLLDMGVETILEEIVTDNEEASDCLLGLTFSKTLKSEMAA
jgi:hypothetical protein